MMRFNELELLLIEQEWSNRHGYYYAPYQYAKIEPKNIDVSVGHNIDMSIALGLIGTDGIVLATDSRLTRLENWITYHEDNSQKLWQLTNGLGLMSIGYNAGYRHFLVDYFNEITLPRINFQVEQLKMLKKLPPNYTPGLIDIVDGFASAIQMHTKSFLEDKYNTLKLAGGMDFIIAGYDGNTPKLLSIDVNNPVSPFVPSFCTNNYCCKGIKDIAIRWIQKIDFINKAFPVELLKKLAVMIILESIKFDDGLGEPIQMAVIDKIGFHKIATIEGNKYQDNNREIEQIKSELDSEHRWLFDYLKQ